MMTNTRKSSDHSLPRAYLYGITLLLLLLGSSCVRHDPSELHRYVVLPHSSWETDDELFFSFVLPDEHPTLQLQGVLHLSATCPYTVLPIGVVYEDSQRRFETEEIQVSLLPQGTQNIGFNIRTVTFDLHHQIGADDHGLYTVSMRHLLIDSIAHGIIEVGIKATPPSR